MNEKLRTQRINIEKEFIAQIITYPYLIDTIQIKPKYLLDKELSKLFQYLIECYKSFEMIHPIKMLEMHEDFNLSLFGNIVANEIVWKESLNQKIDYFEDFILKSYKEDVISNLNVKLNTGEITYEKFTEYIKRIDEIQIVKDTKVLTTEEILNNIDTKQIGIKVNNYAKFNSILNLVQGDLLVIGAKTATGKSSFLLNIMNGLMDRYQCIYFNMEMSKSTIYKRMIAINADVPVNDILFPQSDYQKSVIDRAIKKIEESQVIVEHEALDIKHIRNIVSRLKNKDKHTIVFIDHLGLTRCSEKGGSLYEQTTEVAKQLRQMCIQYNCTVIAASQLNRGAYGAEEITLNMLKDSGEIENSASKIILLNLNPEESKENLSPMMDIDVAKNRDGRTGIIEMVFDKTHQVFKEKRL